jgi:hypothetical protein
MTETDQIRDDLSFVRAAVARRDSSPLRFSTPYYFWAVYVLIGYSLLDINPAWANWFFSLAWVPVVAACGIAEHFWKIRHGEINRETDQKITRHFFYGSVLAVAAVIGLACCNPAFRGPVTGQVMVVLLGIIYFLAGVHLDPSFLWLGPVLIVGGVTVGLVPHYGWTALGIVIAGGLCAAAMINARRQRRFAAVATEPS